MRRFRPPRRLIAALGISVLAAAMSFMSAGFASAAPTNASTFGAEIDARLEFTPAGVTPVVSAGADLRPIGSVRGTVNGSGALAIGTTTGISLASSIDPIDRVRDTVLQAPLDQVRIDMPRGLVGGIDATAGRIELFASAATYNFLGLEGPETFACATAPVDIHLRATDYNAKTGTATLLSDPALRLPPLTAATPTCDHTGDLAALDLLPTGDIGVKLVAHVTIAPRITPQTPIPPASKPPAASPTTRAAATPATATPPSATPGPSTSSLSGAVAGRRAPSSTGGTTSKATRANPSKSAAAGKGSTSTTGYVWKGGAGPDLFDEGDGITTPRAVARPPLVPQPAASRSDADGNRFGIGVIALIAGGTIGGVLLLRTEARRLFRRRPRALF